MTIRCRQVPALAVASVPSQTRLCWQREQGGIAVALQAQEACRNSPWAPYRSTTILFVLCLSSKPCSAQRALWQRSSTRFAPYVAWAPKLTFMIWHAGLADNSKKTLFKSVFSCSKKY